MRRYTLPIITLLFKQNTIKDLLNPTHQQQITTATTPHHRSQAPPACVKICSLMYSLNSFLITHFHDYCEEIMIGNFWVFTQLCRLTKDESLQTISMKFVFNKQTHKQLSSRNFLAKGSLRR